MFSPKKAPEEPALSLDPAADAGDGAMIDVIDITTGAKHELRTPILTMEGGPLDGGEQIRSICAISDDGVVLVSRSHQRAGRFLNIVGRGERLGLKLKEPAAVDLATIKLVYERAASARPAAALSGQDDIRNRRSLLDIIAKAAKLNASDIHIAVRGRNATIEIGVNGQLEKGDLIGRGELHVQEAKDLMATAFFAADSSDQNYKPLSCQNARIVADEGFELPANVQAIRAAWSPLAQEGRYLVLRLFYQGQQETQDLGALGYSKAHLRLIKRMRARPQGLIALSGPTGSGKSTTLFCAVKALIQETRGRKNVITVENPVEYIIDGAKQVSVDADKIEELAKEYAEAIRIALRQAPKILMIGEIRDGPSSALVFEAVETGHAVWTSIHTSSADGIPSRLLDLGVRADKIFDVHAITGLIGQRLVPALCPHCKLRWTAALDKGLVDLDLKARVEALMKAIKRDPATLFVANPRSGCKHCGVDGLKGRTVCAEIIMPDETFMDLLRSGQRAKARTHWLENLGGATMLAHGISKMLAGILGPAEVETNIDILRHEPFMDRLFVERTDDVVDCEPAEPAAG